MPGSGLKSTPVIHNITPPFRKFFSKAVHYHGLLIMSHEVVCDEALIEAYNRISRMLKDMPAVLANLLTAKAEFHIIGIDQETTDLPEHRRRKNRKRGDGLTFDQRNRGVGGLFSSCGEENLLRLTKDRAFGGDACVHEFAHCLMDFGFDDEVRDEIKNQYKISKHKWKAYASANFDEFFAELSTWYFGSKGDSGTFDPPPEPGADWFKQFDPSSYELIDRIYQGRLFPKKYLPQVYTNSVVADATTAFELFPDEFR